MEELKNQSNSRHPSEDKPWLFKPGQSGNPKGRPPGTKTLKTYAMEYLKSLDDDEKLEFMQGIDKKIIWEMAEGKPDNKSEVKLGGDADAPLLVKIIGKDDNGDTTGVRETT